MAIEDTAVAMIDKSAAYTWEPIEHELFTDNVLR